MRTPQGFQNGIETFPTGDWSATAFPRHSFPTLLVLLRIGAMRHSCNVEALAKRLRITSCTIRAIKRTNERTNARTHTLPTTHAGGLEHTTIKCRLVTTRQVDHIPNSFRTDQCVTATSFLDLTTYVFNANALVADLSLLEQTPHPHGCPHDEQVLSPVVAMEE